MQFFSDYYYYILTDWIFNGEEEFERSNSPTNLRPVHYYILVCTVNEIVWFSYFSAKIR